MGLNVGVVPARVDAPTKAGLLELVDHAVAQGFSARWACRQLGVDHARVLSWRARVPMLLAVSDNGPQMRSEHTAQFMAIARIAQHFGRPGTPNDQAWIESFFGHLKAENPHLDDIDDPAVMRTELDDRSEHYNTVRLSLGVGGGSVREKLGT